MPSAPNLARELAPYQARTRLVCAWGHAQTGVLITGLAFALVRVADRLFGLDLDMILLAGVLASACLVEVVMVLLLSGRSAPDVAYQVDRAAGLRNLVASAVLDGDSAGEAAAAVVRRAVTALRIRAPRRLMPLRFARSARWLPVSAVAVLGAMLMPDLDLLGRAEARRRLAVEKAEVRKGALTLTAKLTQLEGKAGLLGSVEARLVQQDMAALAQDLAAVSKQDALLKLGELENRHQRAFAKERELARAARQAQPNPEAPGLNPDSRRTMRELARDLKAGKLPEAAEAMRELARQLESKDLSAAEKKALARELAQLADQLQDKGDSALADKLRDLAASQENLEDLLQSCQDASKELAELADSLDACAAMEAMQEALRAARQDMVGESFRDFNASETEKAMAAEARLGQCPGASCPGCGACAGAGPGSGDDTGGEGTGRGGQPLENRTDTGFQKRTSPSAIQEGRIIQQVLVQGVPDKGEALVEYVEVVESARQQAAAALARERIPREYEDSVKAYFDSIQPTEAGSPAEQGNRP
jgi:hypothetical protein